MLWITMSGIAQWNTDRIILIGRNALYYEDYVLSIQYFNQVIKIKPYLYEPYMYRAIAKIQLGDHDGAIKDASIAIQKNPFTPLSFYARGFANMRVQKFDSAEADFSKALEFSPDSYPLLMNRSNAREMAGNFEGALRDVETNLRLSPKSYQLHFEKGRILLSMKDTAGAENAFTKYTDEDKFSPVGWSALGLLNHQKKKFEQALKFYDKAVENKTTFYGDYINRGIVNVELKNYMNALKDYDQAIKMKPDNSLVYYNRGLLRATLGDDNNAYQDLDKVIKADSSLLEARYNMAMLSERLKKYPRAISEYNKILEKYPYFIPALWGKSHIYMQMGNERESFRYREQAIEIEKNKEKYKQKMANLKTGNLLATETQGSQAKKNIEIFNRNIEQQEDAEVSKYDDKSRGAVQHRMVDIVNESNFVLSYYSKQEDLRRTNLYHPLLTEYNRKKVLSTELKITNKEIPLTAELIDQHFAAINRISEQLSMYDNDPDLYFHRALEFALVKDFNSSIEDLNKAVILDPTFTLAYFTRANIRYMLIEYLKNNQTDETQLNLIGNSNRKNDKLIQESKYKLDFELIMRDYDRVSELQPDFIYAYFNKANILCDLNDYKSAIRYYNRAIEQDSEFAESFFNRGLTYLFLGQDDKGLADLSKAGEQGIYGAYNLLQRFSKN